MIKSTNSPVLKALLSLLAVILCPLALSSCPGNGEAAGSHDDATYPPGGRNRGGG